MTDINSFLTNINIFFFTQLGLPCHFETFSQNRDQSVKRILNGGWWLTLVFFA